MLNFNQIAVQYAILACPGVGLFLGGCAPGKPDLLTKPSDAEQQVTAELDAIDKGDADRLLAMDQPEEAAGEGLDRKSLGKLIEVFRRETAGSTRGPMVVNGPPSNLAALINYYSKDGHLVTNIALNVSMSGPLEDQPPTGKPYASALAYHLLMAAAVAERPSDVKPLTGTSGFREIVAGLQDLRAELERSGPPKYCRGIQFDPARGANRLNFQTYDELIEGVKRSIASREARGAK